MWRFSVLVLAWPHISFVANKMFKPVLIALVILITWLVSYRPYSRNPCDTIKPGVVYQMSGWPLSKSDILTLIDQGYSHILFRKVGFKTREIEPLLEHELILERRGWYNRIGVKGLIDTNYVGFKLSLVPAIMDTLKDMHGAVGHRLYALSESLKTLWI